MEQELIDFSWDFIDNIENVDKKVEAFQENLFAIFSECCPLKSRVISNNSEPYYTEKLRRLKRRKSREFTKHRNSHKYSSLLRLYKQELKRAKKSFYNLKIKSLKTSNSKMWYSSLKKLLKYDKKEEVLLVESIKHLSDEEQAERIADKFAEVSNEYEPLNRNAIKVPVFEENEMPKILEGEV